MEKKETIGLHLNRLIETIVCTIFTNILKFWDHLFGIVVSTSDCHPRGPGFDSRLYPRNFSGSRPIGSGTGSTQPREDNWVATFFFYKTGNTAILYTKVHKKYKYNTLT